MKISWIRVRAIYRKELREYRRNSAIVSTMAVLPIVFAIPPLIQIFALKPDSASALVHLHPLLYLLGIPAIVPAVLSSYAVVGERQQGSLEPVLTTPIRGSEFLLAKALAALVPSLLVSYAVFGLVLASIELFTQPGVAPALVHGPDVIAQVVLTPLLAGLAIWLGMAVSARVKDIRVAQQFGVLASLPSAIVTSLVAYNVIHPTLKVALGSGIALLVLNRLGWRLTSALFNRERLVST